jgi:PAS domain S-box-containing protein
MVLKPIRKKPAAPAGDPAGTNAALRRKIAAYEKVKQAYEAERIFRKAVEDALITGIIVTDAGNRVVHVNRALCRMLGWRRKELIGCVPPYMFWPPEDHARRLAAFRRSRRGGTPPGGIKARFLRRNGERFDVLILNSRMCGADGAFAGLVASFTDITDQVRVEAELRVNAERLRLLSTELLSIEERERSRIARELHDSLGQALSALKYRIEEAVSECRSCPGEHGAIGRLAAAATALGDTIGELRSIVMDLRPTVLDDLGLITAIGWLGREYQETHPGVRVRTRIGVREAEVPERIKTTLFRLLQESLNNSGRHSGADLVGIGLSRRGGRLELTVRDNGRGFVRRADGKGFGLIGMKERTELSEGTFAVASEKGNGTVVKASWPLPAR